MTPEEKAKTTATDPSLYGELEVPVVIERLHRVVENADQTFTYDDIMREISLAYRAASKAADSSDEKSAIEIRDLLTKLNEMAEQRKTPKVETTTLKDMKEKEKKQKAIPKPVLEEQKLEEPEPKPQEQLIPEPIAETEVTSAKSTLDVSPTEPIGEVEQPKKEKTIPAPSTEEPEKPSISIPKQVPIPEAPKPKMELVEPENETETIIVTKQSDENAESEVKEETQDVYDELSDIFTPKPFDGDDDIDTDKNTEEKQELNVQTKEDIEAARIKQVDEEYGTIPEDTQMLNIKSISRKKVSETLKALASLDTSKLDIQKLEMFDFDVEDQSIRKEYLKTRNDMISAPRISRIALLMSGHYEEIAAYGNYDLVGVQRSIYSKSSSYADKERKLLESIYSHVNYVSYSKEKPDFDTWASNIYYPDVQALYFGVYDANSVGANHYAFDCPYCGTEVNINIPNADLSVAVPKELTKNKLEEFITNKDIMALDSTELSKWAKTTRVRKILPDTNIIVDFAVPTIYEYLTTLFTLQKINLRDLDGRLDLSILDGLTSEDEEEEEQQIEDFNRIMTCIYIKQIGIPAKVEGSNQYRYIKITNKADIIEHVNGLTENDYDELLRGKEVRDLITKTATRYYITNTKCVNDNCGKNIKYVSISPKQIFFFKIGESRNKRMM